MRTCYVLYIMWHKGTTSTASDETNISCSQLTASTEELHRSSRWRSLGTGEMKRDGTTHAIVSSKCWDLFTFTASSKCPSLRSEVFSNFQVEWIPTSTKDRLSAELRRLRSLNVRRVEWTLENCQRLIPLSSDVGLRGTRPVMTDLGYFVKSFIFL